MLPPTLQAPDIPEHILEVVRRLQSSGFKCYLVGGCVRDLLRGTRPKDWDVTTSARPEEVQAAFKKVIPTGIQHGTVTVVAHREHVEVTTFRSEGVYLDGRRPSSVAFETDVRADLSRRDFTINALAFDPVAPELCDPFGGQADLAAGVIRCVGEASERFGEDGLRPLRAVRFAAVLGFQIAPSTLAAIPEALPSFRKVSLERVRDEFCKLLVSPRPAEGLELLRSTGMLEAFLPELAAVDEEDWERRLRRARQMPAELVLRLAAALYPLDRSRDILLRLKFPNRTAETVALWIQQVPRVSAAAEWSDVQVRRLLADVGLQNVEPILQVAQAKESLRAQIQSVLAQAPPLDPRQLALKGQDIMRILGVGPSPEVGEATRFLFDRVLEKPEQNTPEGLTQLLRKWRP